jgi:glycerol-3-phosphate dehydrogenase (NAD(P)+)
MSQVGIIGGGAFGTAMACVLRRHGHAVRLWAREPDVVTAINTQRANPVFLPGVALAEGIVAAGDESAVVHGADFVVLAPPAQHMRAVTLRLQKVLARGTPVVTCAKGIERGTGALMSQVIGETLPASPIAVLSGPSFAAEIAVDLPTGVTLACADPTLGEWFEREIGMPRFRVYLSDDPIGAHIGGVMKNVLAIACGIATGRRLGANARATLIARGLAESLHLGLALGARFETFLGLSGIGDIDLSCNSPQSRNMSLGIALGQGRVLAEVLAERVTVQEGVFSAEAVVELAARRSVPMPIAGAVDAVLNRGAQIDAAIETLLALPVGVESDVVQMHYRDRSAPLPAAVHP